MAQYNWHITNEEFATAERGPCLVERHIAQTLRKIHSQTDADAIQALRSVTDIPLPKSRWERLLGRSLID
jgi:hypothetical protein